MKVEDFILKIEDEFEDLEKGKLKPDSCFKEHFDWNSINALIFIALVDTEYEVSITPDDIRNSETVSDLFSVIVIKMSE